MTAPETSAVPAVGCAEGHAWRKAPAVVVLVPLGTDERPKPRDCGVTSAGRLE